jgi:hypothetical protein
MTSLQLTTLAMLIAAACAAVTLARRDIRNRPVAWYLVAVTAVDLLRWVRTPLLPPTTVPREGWELVLRHAEQLLYLAAILALPAMAMALFLRRRPLGLPTWVWCSGFGLSIWSSLIGHYPEIRGRDLMQVYEAVEFAGIAVSVGCFIMWLRSPWLLEEGPSAPVLSGLALIAGVGATAAVPRITGDWLLASWEQVVAANATGLVLVIVLQLWPLLIGRARA